MTKADTIAAIATYGGSEGKFAAGAIAIIRMSGPEAGVILDRVFEPKAKKNESFPMP